MTENHLIAQRTKEKEVKWEKTIKIKSLKEISYSKPLEKTKTEVSSTPYISAYFEKSDKEVNLSQNLS